MRERFMIHLRYPVTLDRSYSRPEKRIIGVVTSEPDWYQKRL